MFYAEDYGGQQYRLRIQWHNPYDKRQWFTFDARTNTIRAFYKRDFCIGNQIGQGFKINVGTAIRKYTGTNQDKIRWYTGAKQNIRNNGGKCLDVHGGKNDDHRHVIFWNCHKGVNQAWWVDPKEKTWPKQPLKDGTKFLLRSRMKGGRALYKGEDIGGQ